VNLFAGGYHDRTDREPREILDLLAGIHRDLGIDPPAMPNVPPDPFREQLAAILDERPPVFSFTFGVPTSDEIDALHGAGIVILGTATTVAEGGVLEKAGVDAVVAQGAEAGAHRGTFLGDPLHSLVPTLHLTRDLASALTIPVIASGGIMTRDDVAAALDAGAEAVQLGTAFLACDEAGTSRAYRDALLAATSDTTVITRAFSGRHARGLRNAFIEQVAERDELLLPYPIQNSLTRPMRSAAAAQGKAQYLSLWAGTGVTKIRAASAAEIVRSLVQT